MTAILSIGPSPSDLTEQIITRNAPAYTFSFTPFLRTTYRHGIPASRPVCKPFQQGHCPLGSSCPDRHVVASTRYHELVCKHWLRGLCKKGDSCEFLHEYNLRKMPECGFFAREGFCLNKEECLYSHPTPYAKKHTLVNCDHYDRGFCPLGPRCSKRHTRRDLCVFYLCGFCPDGPRCNNAHPRWRNDLEAPEVSIEHSKEDEQAEEDRLRERWEELERDRDSAMAGGRFGSMDAGRGRRWRDRRGGQQNGAMSGGRGRRREY